MKIYFNKAVTQNYDDAIKKEWLETNGLGGWASSTIIGANTRRYHGLLVAATKPPVGRTVLVSKLDETIVVNNQRFELGCNQFPNMVHPHGYRFLQSFAKELFPMFNYVASGVHLKKTVAAVHGENTTLVMYEVLEAPSPFMLELQPFIAARDFHSLGHANDAIASDASFRDGIFQVQPYEGVPQIFIAVSGASFESRSDWYYRFEYPVEQYRGLDFQEDLFSSGIFRISMVKGDKLGIIISTTDPVGKDAVKLFNQEKNRRQKLLAHLFAQDELMPMLGEIIDWHRRGTRYSIHVDNDGLLCAGESGVQLTWMDAKMGDWVVTPRQGKAVEINALWYNALKIYANLLNLFGQTIDAQKLDKQAARLKKQFQKTFWYERGGYLYDYIDGDHRDIAVRPDQLFAISLPFPLLPVTRARQVLKIVEKKLYTPYGLRSLAPDDPNYRGSYGGNQYSRDSAYHQGTVWSWLLGPMVDAILAVEGKNGMKRTRKIIENFTPHLQEAGIGTISEIFDADAPHAARGCIAQAWSVGEILRVYLEG